MKRIVLSLVLLLLCVCPLRADLNGQIKTVLQDKLLKNAEVGIAVMRLHGGSPQFVYQHDPQTLLTPASNLKIVTTSAALDKLGADFRFRTILALHGRDLVIFGDGDPTFGDNEFLKKVGWDTLTVYRNWAAQLRKANITAVQDVIVDDGIFDQQFLHPRWTKHQYNRYGAAVGGLNLNANCIDFYLRPTSPGQRVGYSLDPATSYITVTNECITGRRNAIELARGSDSTQITLKGEADRSNEYPVSLTVADPPIFAATTLADTLKTQGVAVNGQVRRDRSLRKLYGQTKDQPGQWRIISIHETPLKLVLARANKDSMNLYAEALCKRLGAAASGQSGSWENGTAAVGAFLRHIGVPQEEFHLDDGSGLSKENAISAQALVRVLAYDFNSPNASVFMESLAVGGQDGTLKNRFDSAGLRGRVFGKSGFVESVSSLSGYLKGRDEQWYAFSILINGIPPYSNTVIKELQEKIVKAVDDSTK